MSTESATASRGELVIHDPRDGTPVGRVAVTGPERAREATARAQEAWGDWRRRPVQERGHALHRAADAIAGHRDELAELEQRETGRRHADALGGIDAAAETLRQIAELAPTHRGKSLRGSVDALDLTRAEPYGVAAILTPWNDPVAVTAGLVGAALATGNTVVSKPSERCPHLGQRLGELLGACFPAGVMQTVIGDGGLGEALIAAPDVRLVAHVGSTAAGERIARAVALTGAHLLRENGGNDALIVDADVDPGWAAAEAARGAFTNTGQLCTAVERIFVHRDLGAEFLAALVEEAARLNRTNALAPLVDDRMREAVHALVADSRDRGANVLVGGEPGEGPGCFYPATVLADCDTTMPLFQEEIFGPVAPVMVVDDFSTALALAAADDYGLQATVLTRNLEHAMRAVDALPVGTVKINDVFGGAPGGSAEPRGRSGSGFGYGPELLDEMTTVKVVHLGPGVGR